MFLVRNKARLFAYAYTPTRSYADPFLQLLRWRSYRLAIWIMGLYGGAVLIPR
jgi:hypothetical protein